MATHTFSRQELYDLVWSEPMAKLAARFGLSGRGLAKACEKAQIPVPERGYWAKVQAGRPAEMQPLPKAGATTPAQVTINPPGARAERPEPPPPPPSVQERIEAEQRPEVRVAVPKTLASPHRIVAAWLDDDRRERTRSRRDPIFARLYKPIDGTELAKRRLRILSALFKALEDRQYKLIVEHPYRNAVQVALGEATLDISLSERIRQYRKYLTEKEKAEQRFLSSDQKWTQEKAPTGELILKIKETGGWVAQEWRETADEPMEDQLNAVLGRIAGAFEEIRLRRERQAEERARDREIQRQRHEREMEQKREAVRFRRLLKACENHRAAADIRGLVEAVERSPLALEHAKAFEQWKGWALEHAVRIDPLCDQRLFDLEVSDHEAYRL